MASLGSSKGMPEVLCKASSRQGMYVQACWFFAPKTSQHSCLAEYPACDDYIGYIVIWRSIRSRSAHIDHGSFKDVCDLLWIHSHVQEHLFNHWMYDIILFWRIKLTVVFFLYVRSVLSICMTNCWCLVTLFNSFIIFQFQWAWIVSLHQVYQSVIDDKQLIIIQVQDLTFWVEVSPCQ